MSTQSLVSLSMSTEEGYGSTSDIEDNNEADNVELPTPPITYAPCQCLKCDQLFSTRELLMYHLDLHYVEANARKPNCDMSSSSSASRVRKELNLFPDPLGLTLAPPTSLVLDVAIENHDTHHRAKKREKRAEGNADNSDLTLKLKPPMK